jgi:hypothetical protein
MHGLRKKIAENKKEELTDYMERAVALVHNYMPPSSERMQLVFQAGAVALAQAGPGKAELQFHNYLKQGDSLVLSFATATKAIVKIGVKSYLDDAKDAVALDVVFRHLPDGTNYTSAIVLNAPAKEIQVRVTSTNFQRLAR